MDGRFFQTEIRNTKVGFSCISAQLKVYVYLRLGLYGIRGYEECKTGSTNYWLAAAALSFSACALKNLTSPLCTSPYPRGITNLSWIHPGNCALTPSGGIRPCEQNTMSV